MKTIEDIKESFQDFSNKLGDHRHGSHTLHSVTEILFLTLCAIICGCEGWRDIERYGKAKVEFLRKFFPYKNGIPSDDTVRRFFRSLTPSSFQKYFVSWVAEMGEAIGHHIALDGKVSRRSFDNEGDPLHMVSAFASESRLVLGQEKVADKSNEIKAIPVLLDMIDIEGATITIDAMGCQRDIAKNILDKKANYVLSLKGNQGNLHKDVELTFQDKELVKALKASTHMVVDKNKHGRQEERTYTTIALNDELKEYFGWPHIETITQVLSQRKIKGKSTQEKRYYISSLAETAKVIGQFIRAHWSVENTLHWILDISFRDDESRIRKGNAPQNAAIIKHMTLNMLQKAKGKRDSIKQMRKAAGWDEALLLEILQKI